MERTPRSAEEEELLPAAVRVLTNFAAEDDVVLGPGDALYLPPRCAHHGVSSDCPT